MMDSPVALQKLQEQLHGAPAPQHSGLLQRLSPGGLVSSYKSNYYAKEGVFLKEEGRRMGTLSRHPKEVIDLTSARVEETSTEINKAESFAVFTRNDKEYHFLAPSLEDKARWLAALRDTSNNGHLAVHNSHSIYSGGSLGRGSSDRSRRNSMPAQLFNTVRRMHTRNDALREVMTRRVAIVESDRKGKIIHANVAAERMFGYPESELVGRNTTVLIPSQEQDHESALGKYRKLTGVRKGGDQFALQVVLEQATDGSSFVSRIIELEREGHNANNNNSSSSNNSGTSSEDEYLVVNNLRVRLIDGKNVGGPKKKDHSRDPYCVLLVDQVQRGSSSTKLANTDPFWGEEFFFDDIAHNTATLTVLVNNFSKATKDPRIGQVQVNLLTRSELGNEKSYPIVPLQGSNVKSDDLGSLRLKVSLTEEKILPFKEYNELLEFVLREQTFTSSLLQAIAGQALEEIAGTIVNIFSMSHKIHDFISMLLSAEISNTGVDHSNVIFRGNTLTTKVIDVYMKVTGFDYLNATLSPLLDEIFATKLDCEIDPSRIQPGATIAENLMRLSMYCKRVWDAIDSSTDKCPVELQLVFERIRIEVSQKWPNNVVRYTAISGFIFLRFFCPAILNPVLFGLVEDHPDQRNNPARTLTLIAKTMQNLANLVQLGDKEPWFKSMNDFILANTDRMQKCIVEFATPRSREVPGSNDDVDHQTLRRELAALYRHLVEKREESDELLQKMVAAGKDVEMHYQLQDILRRLERRYHVYERSKNSTLRSSLYGNVNWEAASAQAGGKSNHRSLSIALPAADGRENAKSSS